MLTTGNQLRAARALAGLDQGTLAERAGLNINTIGSMEKRGAATLTSGLDKVKAVMSALEAAGVEFLNHGQPGVRLKAGYQPPVSEPEFDPFGGKDGFQTQVGEPRRSKPSTARRRLTGA